VADPRSAGYQPVRHRPDVLDHVDPAFWIRWKHIGPRAEQAGGIDMTVVIGLAPGDRARAAVSLGTMLARSANQRLVVTAVVPEPWPPHPLRLDEEFLAHQASMAEKALADAQPVVGNYRLVDYVLRHARSVSSGLLDVAEENDASYVVLGSSPNAALNRVAIGGVADRILHSAGVPVVVAPRNSTFRPGDRLSRITVAFGRGDGDSDLLARATGRAMSVGAHLRVACFAVEPLVSFASLATLGSAAAEAETLITDRWVDYLKPIIVATLEQTTSYPSADTIDIAVGRGSSWADALTDIAWADDEILVIGTSSSPIGRLFLGSHAAKIVRNSPVPVMLVPRSVLDRPADSG
jgi:nucleotide-binding universal stress UspA family protein